MREMISIVIQLARLRETDKKQKSLIHLLIVTFFQEWT